MIAEIPTHEKISVADFMKQYEPLIRHAARREAVKIAFGGPTWPQLSQDIAGFIRLRLMTYYLRFNWRKMKLDNWVSMQISFGIHEWRRWENMPAGGRRDPNFKFSWQHSFSDMAARDVDVTKIPRSHDFDEQDKTFLLDQCDNLTDRERQAVWYSVVEGMANATIEKMLGWSTGSAYCNVKTGMAKLKERWDQ